MKTISQTLNLVSDGLPFFQAEWPAPANVKTLVSTRNGGVSQAPYASLNVGGHVGDRPENVARNREIVQAAVPVPPQTCPVARLKPTRHSTARARRLAQ